MSQKVIMDGGYEKYSLEWYKKMTEIWRDRIDLMGCVRTGALRESVHGQHFITHNYDINATFRFLLYGLYVDAGTGRGYEHDNGGDLAFLGKAWRKENHMGKARQRRPWFSTSWRISREVLKNKLSHLIGEEFVGAVTRTLSDKDKASLKNQ